MWYSGEITSNMPLAPAANKGDLSVAMSNLLASRKTMLYCGVWCRFSLVIRKSLDSMMCHWIHEYIWLWSVMQCPDSVHTCFGISTMNRWEKGREKKKKKKTDLQLWSCEPQVNLFSSNWSLTEQFPLTQEAVRRPLSHCMVLDQLQGLESRDTRSVSSHLAYPGTMKLPPAQAGLVISLCRMVKGHNKWFPARFIGDLCNYHVVLNTLGTTLCLLRFVEIWYDLVLQSPLDSPCENCLGTICYSHFKGVLQLCRDLGKLHRKQIKTIRRPLSMWTCL